jgi:hypothetical protein
MELLVLLLVQEVRLGHNSHDTVVGVDDGNGGDVSFEEKFGDNPERRADVALP